MNQPNFINKYISICIDYSELGVVSGKYLNEIQGNTASPADINGKKEIHKPVE